MKDSKIKKGKYKSDINQKCKKYKKNINQELNNLKIN